MKRMRKFASFDLDDIDQKVVVDPDDMFEFIKVRWFEYYVYKNYYQNFRKMLESIPTFL